MKNWSLFFLKFALPIFIWLLLFRSLVFGKAMVLLETYTIYSGAKFFTDNIINGVFPLWNPYVMLGYPQKIMLCYFGAYNPIWLLMPFFQLFGVASYQSFVFTITIYFFLGILGFYLLSKALIQNALVNYMAFLLFMFSSFSLVFFPDIQPALVFIPGVWFFYFLVRFVQFWERRYFIGLTFAGMLTVTTYLPFYFITVFLPFSILFALVYFSRIPALFVNFFSFCGKNKLVVVLCSLAFLLSLFPGGQAYLSTKNFESVVTFRHFSDEGKFYKGAEMDEYDIVSDGGVTARMMTDDLYSRLDDIPYGNNGFFYIPLFGFIILLIGSLLKITKRLFFLLLLNLILFLVLLESTTPIHPWLFKNVYFFKLTRNLFFILQYFAVSMILLMAEIFHNVIIYSEKTPVVRKRIMFFVIVMLHLSVVIFLNNMQYIIDTMYLTLFLSVIFWWMFLFSRERMGVFFLSLFLFFTVMAQPLEVVWKYNQKAKKAGDAFQSDILPMPKKEAFQYVRPEQLVFKGHIKQLNANSWGRIWMSDVPGYIPRGFPTFWSYYLARKFTDKQLYNYAKYKFLLYDKVDIVNSQNNDFAKVKLALKQSFHAAIVADQYSDKAKEDLKPFLVNDQVLTPESMLVIDYPSAKFKVTKFNVCSVEIETNFFEDKILVHNDSYSRYWRAYINGKRVPLYRANFAFKAIILKAGKNRVQFVYVPFGGTRSYWLVYFTFIAMLMGLFFLFVKDHQRRVLKGDIAY